MNIEYEFSIKKIGNSFGKANVLIYCHMPDGTEHYVRTEKKTHQIKHKRNSFDPANRVYLNDPFRAR